MAAEAIYYIDSCVFLDFIELPTSDPGSVIIANIIEDAEKGRFRLVTSTITLAEVLWAKEESDRKKVDKTVQAKIENLFHPASSPVELIPVHEIIAREAQKLLRGHLHKGWKKTKGVDAIHLVTAKREGVDEFLTTEQAMSKWGKQLGFKVCEPHYDSPSKPSGEETTGLFTQESKEPDPTKA